MIHDPRCNLPSRMALLTAVWAVLFILFFALHVAIRCLVTSEPLSLLLHVLLVAFPFSLCLYLVQNILWHGLHRGEYQFLLAQKKNSERGFSMLHSLHTFVKPLSFRLGDINIRYHFDRIMSRRKLNHFSMGGGIGW
jgi:hypothetical protein